MSGRLIRSLQEENERLREQVAQLRAALSECPPLPAEWGLTVQQTLIFGVLLRRPCATHETLMTVLYSDRSDADAVSDPAVIRAFICAIRRKLRPFDVTISTRWGHGYALDEQTRARLNGILARAAA